MERSTTYAVVIRRPRELAQMGEVPSRRATSYHGRRVEGRIGPLAGYCRGDFSLSATKSGTQILPGPKFEGLRADRAQFVP